MVKAGEDLSGRILSFLRARGIATSSHMLAARFLKMAVSSEELATRLLRPLIEPAGASYTEGSGWVVPPAAAVERAEARFVAAVFDVAAGRTVLAPPGGPPEGAIWVVRDPRADAPPLLAWLRKTGLPRPTSIVSLRAALRGAARIPRGAGLPEICAMLGIRWLDTEDAAGAAGAMAACLAEAALRRAGRAGEVTTSGDDVALPGEITRDVLAALPEGAGVYRFFDAAGDLLYVGKAANLRRRVSSYFTPGAALRPRRFYSRIHRLEYDLAGSELEALLREARVIRRRAPVGNVQIEVHEREVRFGAARSLAVLLPRPEERGATAVFVRDGRYLGHVRIGPRGGGLATARGLLGRAIRGRPGADRRGDPLDRDSGILNSWLASHAHTVSRVELDSFRRESDAARALREAVRAVLREPGTSLFR